MRRAARIARPSSLVSSSASARPFSTQCPSARAAQATTSSLFTTAPRCMPPTRSVPRGPVRLYSTEKEAQNGSKSENTPENTSENITDSTKSETTNTPENVPETTPENAPESIPESLRTPESAPESDPANLVAKPTGRARRNKGKPVELEPTNFGAFTPPPRRTWAEAEDEISDPDYVPASTTHGLESVGGLDGFWDQPENWDREDRTTSFNGFRPARRVENAVVLEAAIRQAFVETLVIRQACDVKSRQEVMARQWALSPVPEPWINAEVSRGEGGEAIVTNMGSDMWDYLKPQAAEEIVAPRNKRALKPTVAEELVQGWNEKNKGWKSLLIPNATVRFTMNKRIFQLTGQRVRDHDLDTVNTPNQFLQLLKKPEKPKTLAQELEKTLPHLATQLEALPNLTMHKKRVTRGDKDQAYGRAKLIEAELKLRDLPVKGHGWVAKGQEIERMRGTK